MSTFERFEGDLPMLLEELAPPRTPDYLDSVFTRTARTPQRPAWSFRERWLSMTAITQRWAAPRVPMRALLALAVLLLALVAAGLYVGSQQRHGPTPFGPADNGLLAYTSVGDIYVGDPATGTSRLLVGGPEYDEFPGFSPDGSRLAFLRRVGGASSSIVNLFTINPDGTGLLQINKKPLLVSDWINWTPTSTQFVVGHPVTTNGVKVTQLDLVNADGSGTFQTITTADSIDNVAFRPPDGREIVYRAVVDGKVGLYTSALDGSNRRTLITSRFDPEFGNDLDSVSYSSDGSRIFYQLAGTAPNPDDACCRLWVMNADGQNAHEFVPPADRAWDGMATVSPDGTKVAYWHHPNDEGDPALQRLSVARSDGTGPVVLTGPKVVGQASWSWSPDSSSILLYDEGVPGHALLLDPAGGQWTAIPWQVDGGFDWQRLAKNR